MPRQSRSSARSYGGKITDLLAFLLPFLLLGGLALGGGGYDLFARHLTGILAWALVGLLLIGHRRDPIRPGKWFALVGGLLLALALLSLLSSLWSSSVSSSLVEFERGIGLLGIFTASYLTMRTPKQREWFVRGIGGGIAVVVLLALGDRIMPGEGPGSTGVLNRLTYPLGYWNGNGVVFSSGFVIFTWLTATLRSSRWRLVTISLAVLAATALYFTYSRGGLVVTVIATILVLFLAERRLRVLVATLVTVGSVTPILIVADLFPSISGEHQVDPSYGESLVMLVVAAAAVTLAWLLFEGLLRLAARRGRFTVRALEVSRDRRLLLSIAGAGASLVLILTLAFGNSAWNQFTDSDIPAPTEGKTRFTELSGAWRYEFNQVSLDTFSDHPWLGSGAGTYPIEWAQRRDLAVITQDAHSFYLQNLAELGIPGGALALAIPFALVWLGMLAWRRRLGVDAPMMLALVVALFGSLAFDWFWKLGATAALLMLAAAWIVSAETVAPERRRSRGGPGVSAAGLLTAWVAIVILAVPAWADHLNRSSADLVREGRVLEATDRSNLASRLEPWSPDPHLQLGAIAKAEGQYEVALAQFNRAIELDPENWRALNQRFDLYFESGRFDLASEDYATLQELNPIYFGRLTFEDILELNR